MAVYDLPPYTPMDSYLKSIGTIPRNPTLPQTPLGIYTDSIFEANDAALRSSYLRKYNDLMRLIGYKDAATGQIIKGDIETTADQQRAEAQRNMFLAKVDTINQAQNEGNYFSGYQTVRQARAEYPYANQIAGLDISVPKAIMQAQEDAAQALEDYVIARNQEIAQAAQRKADADRNKPPGSGGGGASGAYTPPVVDTGTVVPPPFRVTDPLAPRGGPPGGRPAEPGDLPPGWNPFDPKIKLPPGFTPAKGGV